MSQNPVFAIADVQSIAERLQVAAPLLCHQVNNISTGYHRFSISKGNGKKRWIEAPNPQLKRLQRSLLELLYQRQPHAAAHGFVPGRSIVSNAQPHLGKKWVVNFDIKDFFPSTTTEMVMAVFQQYEYFSPQDMAVLLSLTCVRGCLPQGAPTSPHIANLAFEHADIILQQYAAEHRMTYTRYADDLSFSGDRYPKQIVRFVEHTLQAHGYRLAYQKIKFLGQHKRQMVTGLVVNEKLNIPRPLRKQIRAILHDASKRGFTEAMERSTWTPEQLLGRIALQAMWDEEAAQKQLHELLTLL